MKEWIKNLLGLNKRVSGAASKPIPIDKLTPYMFDILNSDDYKKLMGHLRENLDTLTNLMYPIDGESAAQKTIRQDAFISLAINLIHENPNNEKGLGPDALIGQNDTYEMFKTVQLALQKMNDDQIQASRWAKKVVETEKYRNAARDPRGT